MDKSMEENVAKFEEKLKELERTQRQMLDPVTDFYRLKPGLNAVAAARRSSLWASLFSLTSATLPKSSKVTA